jgi:hypothetical protein
MSSRRPLQSGARFIISGAVSNGATWEQDIAMDVDGAAITDAENWDWTLKIGCPDSPDLTLTTDDALTISQGDTSTTLEIRVARASLASLDGDYEMNIKSLDTSDTTYDSEGKSIHWGKGTVTFINEP